MLISPAKVHAVQNIDDRVRQLPDIARVTI